MAPLLTRANIRVEKVWFEEIGEVDASHDLVACLGCKIAFQLVYQGRGGSCSKLGNSDVQLRRGVSSYPRGTKRTGCQKYLPTEWYPIDGPGERGRVGRAPIARGGEFRGRTREVLAMIGRRSPVGRLLVMCVHLSRLLGATSEVRAVDRMRRLAPSPPLEEAAVRSLPATARRPSPAHRGSSSLSVSSRIYPRTAARHQRPLRPDLVARIRRQHDLAASRRIPDSVSSPCVSMLPARAS